MKHEGLSSAEARKRLELDGYNELSGAGPKSVWRIAAEVIREPMFLLLLACGVLYMFIGDTREGIILLSTIIILIAITFFQHRKTERALEELKKLASPRATVLRDGIKTNIPGRELVIGDLLIIQEGDRVAADALILETSHLSADESLITGESMPVLKSEQSPSNNLFSGSLITQGRAIGRVCATGKNSALGKIATSLSELKENETRLQSELKSLIRKLGIIGVFLSIAVVLIYYFMRGGFVDSLLTGLSSAMAILPEEFPVVLSVFLALGAWRLSHKSVLTRKASAIETLGSATVLCSDKTGTITMNRMVVCEWYDGEQLHKPGPSAIHNSLQKSLFEIAQMASVPDSADPMEIAIRDMVSQFGASSATNQTFVREYPLSRSCMAMTRVYSDADGSLRAYIKGAPETVFEICGITNPDSGYQKALHEMATRGSRVLAVALDKDVLNLPDSQEKFKPQLIGLIALEDPVREGVASAIRECTEAGVRVIMITGDNPVTAKSIAAACQLPAGDVVTGNEIALMSDDELKKRVKQISVFARVIPEQKLRIVQALQSNGEVVAMTGDGVNDAPALKAADIGISMGKKGTDVAREASALVLLDDNFTSIVAGIRLGRRIFDNLQKAMHFILAVHIPIIGLTILPAFFPELPIILWPVHIVFLELIIDPVCSIVFESEQEEKGIMQRPPRKKNEIFFGTQKIMSGLLSGALLLLSVLFIYLSSIQEGHTSNEVRAITFSALIIGNIFLILSSLSRTRSFLSFLFERQKAAFIVLGAASVFLLSIISIPALRLLFGFDYPGLSHFGPSILSAGILLLILESFKLIRQKMLAKA